MENRKIKLERRRFYAFTVNCPKTNKTYYWAAPMQGKPSIVEVSQDTYDYLFMQTTAFKDGELVVLDEVAKEEFKIAISEEEMETITSNTNTKERIEEILNLTTNSMKAELNKITDPEEKSFVILVAQEMELDSAAKRKFLNEWKGIEIDFED